MPKVSTLQNGRLNSVAKRLEPILQATDGGGDEQLESLTYDTSFSRLWCSR